MGRAVVWALAVTVVLAGRLAAGAAGRTTISRQAIEEAVLRAVPGVPPGTLELRGEAMATEARPQLKVDEVKFDASRQWLQARVRCRTNEICMPFYVTTTMRPEKGALTPRESALPKEPPVRLVRAGKEAMLVAASDRVRLTMPVRCLEDGEMGQRVRVRSVAGTVFAAEVVGPGQLRAEY
jgi:hypothetical protein